MALPQRHKKSRASPRETSSRGRSRRRGDESSASSVESDMSSSYQGMSTDEEEEEFHVTSRDEEEEDDEDEEDDEEAGSESEKEDDTSTDDEGSVETEPEPEPERLEDPLARLLASDHTLSRMEINHRFLKEWSSALPIEDIMVEVSRQTSLKTLTIDFEYVIMSKYEDILNSVRHSESLEELILQNAKVNRHTGNAIAMALAENRNSLRRINFHKCTFAGSGFAIMFLGVQHIADLSHLSIEDCGLQGFASEIMSASIPLIKTLKCLRLVKTQLPIEGLRYLCDNIARCTNLVELDLSRNEFDIQSISWLVGALQAEETSIATLSLVKCKLDTQCIEILARGLSDDKTLHALNLRGNKFGSSGAISIINLLKANQGLTKLSVKDCQISRRNIEAIYNRLRYNNSFLKNMFSADVSLAILDSVSLMEKVPESFS